MDPAALAAWTPVAINLGAAAPSVDWGDLSGVRFAEPFFQQTVERWAGGDPAPLVRTGLDALAALDEAPACDPDGLVFHLSRCGSTLVSHLLAAVPGTLVIAEPAPVNALLMAAPALGGEAALVPLLRALIRALGRKRFGDERHYVLKLSSWNVRKIALFRRAFPGVPILWVQRAPDEVMASLLGDPPGWARLQRAPEARRAALDLAPEDGAEAGGAAFYARCLAAMLQAVAADDGPLLTLDYRALPDAIWTAAAPFFGIELGGGDIARMRAEARYDSKSAERRPFAARVHAPAGMTDEVRSLIAQRVAPLYAAMAQRSRGGARQIFAMEDRVDHAP